MPGGPIRFSGRPAFWSPRPERSPAAFLECLSHKKGPPGNVQRPTGLKIVWNSNSSAPVFPAYSRPAEAVEFLKSSTMPEMVGLLPGRHRGRSLGKRHLARGGASVPRLIALTYRESEPE